MLRRLVLAAAVALPACTREPAETWMLGYFSSGDPGPSFSGSYVRHHILEDGDLDYEKFESAELDYVRPRTWIEDGEDAFVMFPGFEDLPKGRTSTS